jgi:hypothetical protein
VSLPLEVALDAIGMQLAATLGMKGEGNLKKKMKKVTHCHLEHTCNATFQQLTVHKLQKLGIFW